MGEAKNIYFTCLKRLGDHRCLVSSLKSVELSLVAENKRAYPE